MQKIKNMQNILKHAKHMNNAKTSENRRSQGLAGGMHEKYIINTLKIY